MGIDSGRQGWFFWLKVDAEAHLNDGLCNITCQIMLFLTVLEITQNGLKQLWVFSTRSTGSRMRLSAAQVGSGFSAISPQGIASRVLGSLTPSVFCIQLDASVRVWSPFSGLAVFSLYHCPFTNTLTIQLQLVAYDAKHFAFIILKNSGWLSFQTCCHKLNMFHAITESMNGTLSDSCALPNTDTTPIKTTMDPPNGLSTEAKLALAALLLMAGLPCAKYLPQALNFLRACWRRVSLLLQIIGGNNNGGRPPFPHLR